MQVFMYSVKCYFKQDNGKFCLSYREYDYLSKKQLQVGDYVVMNNAYGIIVALKGSFIYDDLVQDKGSNYYKFISKISQEEFVKATADNFIYVEELPF